MGPRSFSQIVENRPNRIDIMERVWEGFRGIVHGGVVNTVLDEAMSKAVAGTGTEAQTRGFRGCPAREIRRWSRASHS